MWGQVNVTFSKQTPSRIIPTRVGTRVNDKKGSANLGYHPHACGDKSLVNSIALVYQGSSPRVWGQGKLTSRKLWLARIIPTRVGTRASELNYYFTHRDHPHACGDKVWKNGAKHQFKGSGRL